MGREEERERRRKRKERKRRRKKRGRAKGSAIIVSPFVQAEPSNRLTMTEAGFGTNIACHQSALNNDLIRTIFNLENQNYYEEVLEQHVLFDF